MNKKIMALLFVLVIFSGAVFALYNEELETVFGLSGSSYNCWESDGGLNFDESGVIVNGTGNLSGNFSDHCINKLEIAEAYCRYQTYPTYEYRDCFEMGYDGCSDGECVVYVNESSCYDTDGGKVYNKNGNVYGFLNDSIYYSYEDHCALTDNIIEYYCDGISPKSEAKDCSVLMILIVMIVMEE